MSRARDSPARRRPSSGSEDGSLSVGSFDGRTFDKPSGRELPTREVESTIDIGESAVQFSDVSDPQVIKSTCIRLVPGWKTLLPHQIRVRQMMAGLTNQLFNVSIGEDASVDTRNRKVLFRVYGKDCSELYDPDVEFQVFSYLAQHGVAPQLIGTFSGGRIEEWILGPALVVDDMRTPGVACTVAMILARFHSLPQKCADFPKFDKNPFETLHRWRKAAKDKIDLTLASSTTSETYKTTLRETRVLEAYDLTHDVESLLIPDNAPATVLHEIGFCHNDVQENNILVERSRLRLIDFEYSSYCYRASDIANYFFEASCEYTVESYPFFKIEDSKYPSEELQRLFASVYLSEVHGTAITPMDDDYIPPFLAAAERWQMFTDLLWGFWSIIRAPHNTWELDTEAFDYILYSRERISRFFRRYETLVATNE